MRMSWADDSGNPVPGTRMSWLDPFIIFTTLFEAIFTALATFFRGWSMLLMQHSNDSVETANALELAAVELETIWDEEEE